jgi:hypothetical protein
MYCSSFEVTITGKDKGDLKGKCYQLKIKKLPHDIVKENSYMEVRLPTVCQSAYHGVLLRRYISSR